MTTGARCSLYFRDTPHAEVRQLMARLASIAAAHGYVVAGGGPGGGHASGRGSVAELLRAIDRGEVGLVRRLVLNCRHERYTVIQDRPAEQRFECRCLACGEVFWLEYSQIETE